MNNHILKLLNDFQNYCNEYKLKKVSLYELQRILTAIHSNFENDVPKPLRDDIHDFVVDLETIEIMEEEKNHYQLVMDKINEINLVINQFTN